MTIDEYRSKVDESGCGCRQCNPPVKIDTRHAHLLKTVLTGNDYWRRKKQIEEYNDSVKRMEARKAEDPRLGLPLLTKATERGSE